MLCIYHHSTDPFFNVAADEHIFKNIQEDCFMLWRNDNAIVVGKHQNTLAEINLDFVKEHNIQVVRRLSGGGTVYHDMGNINFSFTQTGKTSALVDFKKYTLPIVEVLQQLGVDARFTGKSDLMIDEKKISGNAEHVFKNKILHHGTLLFTSEIKNLSGALRINRDKYDDKAVRSIPKPVTNISEHLKSPLSIEEFTQKIMEYILSTHKDAVLYEFSKEDMAAIQKLRDEKYTTWEWNFGRSPNYSLKKEIETSYGKLVMNIEVEKGIIKKVKFVGDFFYKKDNKEIEAALINIPHEENAIRKVLGQYPIEEYLAGVPETDLLNALF